MFTGLGCLPGCPTEGGSDCKHAAVEAIVNMLQPDDKRAVQHHLPFQIYTNAFWSVWTTVQVNREKHHVYVGKSAKSIPSHREYDQFHTSAQVLWRNHWDHDPVWWCIRVWLGSDTTSEWAMCSICLKISVSCRVLIRPNREGVFGYSFRMQLFQSVPLGLRTNNSGDWP